MEKYVSFKEAISHIKDGMTVMVGGFLGAGSPHGVIEAIAESDVKDLTIIANDTSYLDFGVGKLVAKKKVKKAIVSHIGTNSETGKQMQAGEMEVVLIPQGTLAEQIRAGGAGLGGILTPTGVGTIVEKDKKKLEIDGKEYLLELPIKADVALIGGSKVDKKGNVYYNESTRNFNTIMATAADLVIVEAEKIVEVGELDANNVMTPSVFVDYITGGEN